MRSNGDSRRAIMVKANAHGEGHERFFIDLFDSRRAFIEDGTARIKIRS